VKEILKAFLRGISLLWILYVSHNIYLTIEGYYLQYQFNMDEKEAFKYVSQTTMPKDCKVSISNDFNKTFTKKPQDIYKYLISPKDGLEYDITNVIGEKNKTWVFEATVNHYYLYAQYHVEDNKVKIDKCEINVNVY